MMPLSVMAVSAAAAMAFSVMIMVPADVVRSVVAAHGVRVVRQGARQKRFHLGIRIARCTGEQADPRLRKGVPRTTPDVAADQGFHPVFPQKSGQGSVPRSVGVHDLG